MDTFVDRLASPIGTILLVWRPAVLQALDFEDHEDRFQRLLRLRFGNCRLIPERAPADIRDPIRRYFEGDLTAINDVAVESNGTPFQRQVWAALREIPVGSTTTYGELATRIGRPQACRAVGLANGSNPVAIVVPCHRVIGANGTLTGYGGGIDRKRWLLEHEQAGLLALSAKARNLGTC